jgi:hypothetical protein
MAKTLTASDRKSLIRLASTMPVGSDERKAILAGLSKTAKAPVPEAGQWIRIVDPSDSWAEDGGWGIWQEVTWVAPKGSGLSVGTRFAPAHLDRGTEYQLADTGYSPGENHKGGPVYTFR